MESWLSRITDYLLAQSWQIAVLTVVVAILSFLLRNRSAHVRYLIWLLVLAKCLVPPLHSVPFAVLPQEQPIAFVESSPMAGRIFDASRIERDIVTEPAKSAYVQTPMAPPPKTTKRPHTYNIRAWLAMGWLVGAVALLFYNLLNALRTQIWLQRQRTTLPVKFRHNVESFFSAHGVKHIPNVWLINGMNQPFVWGLVRGSIYLPADLLNLQDSKSWASLLGHELSHVIRFDAIVHTLQIFAQVVFWFHPFVWWANRKIRAEREKCCDEMTIVSLHALPEDYSEAIVEALAVKYESIRPVPSLAVAGPVKNIEERIKTMLRPGKKFYKHPSLIDATVILLIAFLTVPTALVLTARAAEDATENEAESVKLLHQAAADGDIEQVKLLISKGADVNEKRGLGTPLHYASEKGHTEMVKLLISQGAYVNAWCRPVGTPLHYAAIRGDRQTVELLLTKGADVNAKDWYGRKPLFVAMTSTATGRKEVVELLVAKGAKVPALNLAAYMADIEKVRKCLQNGMDINSQEDFGCAALHAAANSGNKDIVKFLISKGATVDAKDVRGLTPLYYAVMHNYEDIADLLLAKGADVNAKNKDRGGFTLLNYAIYDYGKEAIELLISKGANVNVKDDAGYTPLVYAIWEDDKDVVELLIGKGADVNAEDNDGYTPYYWAVMDASKDLVELLVAKGAAPIYTIHLAAREGDLEKVKRFIEEGADVNAKDKGGKTPLFSAVLADSNDVAKFLIAKGADVNSKDKRGATPINRTIRYHGRNDMVELLISSGADVNTKNNNDETPLHRACFFGLKDVAELLIAKGADVNAKDKTGVTPLYLACLVCRKDVAELLIAKGADVNIKNNKSRTPLHSACLCGHKDIVELLIAKNADINTKDNKEQTALSLAKEQGHDEIVELLRNHGAKD